MPIGVFVQVDSRKSFLNTQIFNLIYTLSINFYLPIFYKLSYCVHGEHR